MTYTLVAPQDSSLADAFTFSFESPTGDLAHALELAAEYAAEITLSDPTGGIRGVVRPDGTFRLD